MPSFYERLARRVVNLETKVNRALSSPQLGSSSIEDGTLEEYDENGQLVTIIGKQPDGTHGAVVVSGPVPPRPSAPAVAPGPGLLSYGWDGNFADETTGETDITIPAPMDFGRVEAHASKFQGFAADTAATLLDTLESPRGGSRTVMLEPGTWFVKLVTRALSGKRSAESLEVSVEVLPPSSGDVDVDALREEFATVDATLAQELNRLAVSKIGLDRLDADGQLTTVVADRVFSDLFATRKLYANQVVVGHPGNLHPDPGFNDPGFLARMAANSTCLVALGASGDLQLTNTDPNGALQLFRPMGTAPTREGVLANGWTAVSPGDVWTFTMTVSSWQGTTGGIRFLGRNADGSTEVLVPEYETIDWPTGKYTLEATIPTGCRWILPEVLVAQGVSYVNQGTIEFRQKITPAMVVDGLIDGQTIRGVDLVGGTITQEANGFRTQMYTHPYRGGVVEFSSGDTSEPGYLSMNDLGGMDIKLPKSGSSEGLLMVKAGDDVDGIFNPMTFSANRTRGMSGLSVDGTVSSKRFLWVGSPVPGDANNLSLVVRDTGSNSPDDQVYNQLAISGRGMVRGTADLKVTAPDGVEVESGGSYLRVTPAASGGIEAMAGTSRVRVTSSSAELKSGNNVLEVRGDGAFLNGAAINTGALTQIQPSLNAGWTHVNISGWTGLWVYQQGKLTIVSGPVQKGSFTWDDVICTLPEKYQPVAKTNGVNAEIDTGGRIQPGGAGGSGVRNLSLTYFAK